MKKGLLCSSAGSVCYDRSESENPSTNMIGIFLNSRQMIFQSINRSMQGDNDSALTVKDHFHAG